MAAKSRRATAQDCGDDPTLLRVQAIELLPMGPEDIRELRVALTGCPDRHGSGQFGTLDAGQ
jgi:hypothetical protein